MDKEKAPATVIDVAGEDTLEAVAGAAASPAEKARPAFVVTTSRQFPSWLADTGGSLAISTYQSGKVILVGSNAQSGRLSVFERSLERPTAGWFSSTRCSPPVATANAHFLVKSDADAPPSL